MGVRTGWDLNGVVGAGLTEKAACEQPRREGAGSADDREDRRGDREDRRGSANAPMTERAQHVPGAARTPRRLERERQETTSEA